MIIKSIIDEDFINYKKASMVLLMPYCSFKCEKECEGVHCHNKELFSKPDRDMPVIDIIKRYNDNDITKAVIFSGMEPLDSFDDILAFIFCFRQSCDDDIIIYTGYREDEVSDKVEKLSAYKNIIVKFGRYRTGQEKHFDDILGVYLASNNQYAKIIS